MATPRPDRPRPTFTRAVLWSGLASGGVFLILVLVLPAVFGGEATLGPPRMIGGLVVAQDPHMLTTGIIIAGVIGHFFLSLLFAFILALVVYRLSPQAALGVGVLYGAALYLLNFYAMAVAFPWFADFRGLATLVSHLAFGATAAWVFKRLHARERSVQPAGAAAGLR